MSRGSHLKFCHLFTAQNQKHRHKNIGARTNNNFYILLIWSYSKLYFHYGERASVCRVHRMTRLKNFHFHFFFAFHSHSVSYICFSSRAFCSFASNTYTNTNTQRFYEHSLTLYPYAYITMFFFFRANKTESVAIISLLFLVAG